MPKIIRLDGQKHKRSRWRSMLWHARRRWRPFPLSRFRLVLPQVQGEVRFSYPVDSAVGRALWMGDYELPELKFFCTAVRPGHVVLDIGANGGLYAVVGSRIVGDTGRLICFEPGRRERRLLDENIRENRLANVSVHPVALSNQNGRARFAISEDGAMNSLAGTDHPLQKIMQWDEVETRKLDTFVADLKLPRVDFIKMDVEGAEQLVFEGGIETLKGQSDLTVLFEASDLNARAFGCQTRELLELIQSLGFQLFYFDVDGQLKPLQEWRDRFGGAIYNFVASKGVRGWACTQGGSSFV